MILILLFVFNSCDWIIWSNRLEFTDSFLYMIYSDVEAIIEFFSALNVFFSSRFLLDSLKIFLCWNFYFVHVLFSWSQVSIFITIILNSLPGNLFISPLPASLLELYHLLGGVKFPNFFISFLNSCWYLYIRKTAMSPSHHGLV